MRAIPESIESADSLLNELDCVASDLRGVAEEVSEADKGERRIPALAAKARGAIAEAFYAVCDLRDEIQGDERFCNADGSDCWEQWGYALSGINDARLHAEEAADVMGCPGVDLGPDLFGGTDGHEV